MSRVGDRCTRSPLSTTCRPFRSRRKERVGTYLLLGMYRGSYCPQPTQLGCTSSLGEQPLSVVYHDGFVRARTFEAAAARAFPGRPPALPAAGTKAIQQEGTRLPPVQVGPVAARRRGHRSRVQTVSRGLVGGPGGGEDCWGGRQQRHRRGELQAETARRSRYLPAIEDLRRRLSGALVVTQLRSRTGRILAELYVRDGTFRVASPPKTLRREGFDVETGIAAAEGRTVELRLSRSSLLLGVEGRLVVRLTNLNGPRNGARLRARIGIERYEGRPEDGPVRVIHDELVVGSS